MVNVHAQICQCVISVPTFVRCLAHFCICSWSSFMILLAIASWEYFVITLGRFFCPLMEFSNFLTWGQDEGSFPTHCLNTRDLIICMTDRLSMESCYVTSHWRMEDEDRLNKWQSAQKQYLYFSKVNVCGLANLCKHFQCIKWCLY